LGFYLIEYADNTTGYSVDACFDKEIAGHSTQIIFKKDLFHLTRYYTREEVAEVIKMLSIIHHNIINSFST